MCSDKMNICVNSYQFSSLIMMIIEPTHSIDTQGNNIMVLKRRFVEKTWSNKVSNAIKIQIRISLIVQLSTYEYYQIYDFILFYIQ